MQCYAVLHIKILFLSVQIYIDLHVIRRGHWISPHRIVYTTQDLAVEAIHIQSTGMITDMESNNIVLLVSA